MEPPISVGAGITNHLLSRIKTKKIANDRKVIPDPLNKARFANEFLSGGPMKTGFNLQDRNSFSIVQR